MFAADSAMQMIVCASAERDCHLHKFADADSVICGPMAANDKGDRLAFVWKDGAILELYQEG